MGKCQSIIKKYQYVIFELRIISRDFMNAQNYNHLSGAKFYRCIINADDFGLNERVNQAIVRSFSSGHVNSASIMVGMPGFHEAVALAKEHELLNAIGIHLNVTEGYPTTDLIKRIPLLVDAQCGRFLFSVSTSRLRLSPHYVAALRSEFSNQIETCIKAGITPAHIDSHHHVHNIWPIGSIVIDLAQEYRIPVIRIARNFGQGISFAKRVYKSLYNLRLRYHGVARSDLMGSLSDAINNNSRHHAIVEIMVHPDLKNGTVIDSLENEPLGQLLEKALK